MPLTMVLVIDLGTMRVNIVVSQSIISTTVNWQSPVRILNCGVHKRGLFWGGFVVGVMLDYMPTAAKHMLVDANTLGKG